MHASGGLLKSWPTWRARTCIGEEYRKYYCGGGEHEWHGMCPVLSLLHLHVHHQVPLLWVLLWLCSVSHRALHEPPAGGSLACAQSSGQGLGPVPSATAAEHCGGTVGFRLLQQCRGTAASCVHSSILPVPRTVAIRVRRVRLVTEFASVQGRHASSGLWYPRHAGTRPRHKFPFSAEPLAVPLAVCYSSLDMRLGPCHADCPSGHSEKGLCHVRSSRRCLLASVASFAPLVCAHFRYLRACSVMIWTCCSWPEGRTRVSCSHSYGVHSSCALRLWAPFDPTISRSHKNPGHGHKRQREQQEYEHKSDSPSE